MRISRSLSTVTTVEQWLIRKNQEVTRGKHIERKYHLLREIVQRGDVTIIKIASAENLADPFTKALP